MGNGDKTTFRLQFNPKVRREFHGATITSDAGLLPILRLCGAFPRSRQGGSSISPTAGLESVCPSLIRSVGALSSPLP